MANLKRVELLRQGVEAWNAWRAEEPSVDPDLRQADLSDENLLGVNLRRANLRGARLVGAILSDADLSEGELSGADLSGADLKRAILRGADARGADLSHADFTRADLRDAIFSRANLSGANLSQANFTHTILSHANLSGTDLNQAILCQTNLNQANLSGAILSGAVLSRADLSQSILSGADLNLANLSGADLSQAILSRAILSGADLRGVDLRGAILVETNLVDAILTDCMIYGISAWGVKLGEGTKQQNLIITPSEEPEITTDDLEVAQFIYLLLHNKKLQRIIDTVTSKVVLILGRFSLPERKQVLDALRVELRKPGRNYVPVVFDFEKPRNQNTLNTIMLLARMARFVIADVSDAKSVLMELTAIVPSSPRLAVQPIIVAGQEEPGMFDFFKDFPWFLKVHCYDTPVQLLEHLDDRVIGPVEAEVERLRLPRA
jgi:uncharacterized protein YjbI with pentapeptide repeats